MQALIVEDLRNICMGWCKEEGPSNFNNQGRWNNPSQGSWKHPPPQNHNNYTPTSDHPVSTNHNKDHPLSLTNQSLHHLSLHFNFSLPNKPRPIDNDKNLGYSLFLQQMQAHNKMIETQLAQIAQQVSNTSSSTQFPSQPVIHEHAKAITLRSGANHEGFKMPSEVNKSPEIEKRGSEGEVEKLLEEVIVEDESDVVPSQEKEFYEQCNEASQAAPKAYVPPIPFPQRLAKKQLNDKFMKFLEVMKGLEVHIPFLQAMSQMPTYAKFLKELLSNKTKLEESATIALTAEGSVVLQNKLPKKLEDPGSFSVVSLF
ncbi:uncharacterized protein LOC125491885 [Beta vulgaris subsp. vulgaris]|uniref:uncharacterized protein LOC125491885 n=1 Tax=Beta vulgaris subsp. vulgaris TaxID=3555 RepID=UPI002546CD00|nr:uncharacterized protein LOC125491885 [Beta vulgaris subsp. vulgaris]